MREESQSDRNEDREQFRTAREIFGCVLSERIELLRDVFEDGVARNEPYRVARHWQKGTRADGKSEQIYGRVTVHVLANTAIESDFCKATGITPMPSEKFAAMLAGVDLDEVVKHLGVEKVKALIAGLNERVPAQPPK